MSSFKSQGRTPTIILLASGKEWEREASKIASRTGIRWIALESVAEILKLGAEVDHDTCVMIDSQHPTIDWTSLHDGMLDNGLEIPVVVSVPAGDATSLESVQHCANFVVKHPIDEAQLVEMVDFAFRNESFVQYGFAVERSYRRRILLNDREREILTLAVEGSPNKQIARKLGYHIKTIERIRNAAYEKLRVRSTAEMTRLMTLAELYQFVRPLNHQLQYSIQRGPAKLSQS